MEIWVISMQMRFVVFLPEIAAPHGAHIVLISSKLKEKCVNILALLFLLLTLSKKVHRLVRSSWILCKAKGLVLISTDGYAACPASPHTVK